MGCSKRSSKREVHSKKLKKQEKSQFLTPETRKISNNQPNLLPKRMRKRRTHKAQSHQMEGNNKDN